MVSASAGSGLFVPDPLESETRVYKKWSDVCLGGERVSRHFAKCLEGVVREDWRRMLLHHFTLPLGSAHKVSRACSGQHLQRGVGTRMDANRAKVSERAAGEVRGDYVIMFAMRPLRNFKTNHLISRIVKHVFFLNDAVRRASVLRAYEMLH